MVINNLLVSESNRQDDIPTHILKLCKNSISSFLVQIFNPLTTALANKLALGFLVITRQPL